jgi:PucR C-terminal helix-turn-helix domain/GGDEF-like domain
VLGIAQSPGPSLSSLMEQLARDGNSLALKLTSHDHGAVVPEAERLGLSVLEIDSAASWTQVVSLLRSITDAAASGDDGEQLGGVAAGDLFAVANAVAALVDAPVTIEDPQSRVIAYSGGQEEADDARMATILGRRIPQAYADKFRSEGIFLRLHRETAPIYLDDIGVDVLPRLAVAVRAGDEVLGSMWAAVRTRPSPERVEAFGEAARFVAMHVLRHRVAADVRRGLHTDLMSLLLSGGPTAATAALRLGLVGSCFRVLACGVCGGEAVDTEALLLRLSDTLALHLSLVQRGAVCAAVDGVLYAVLPVPADPARGRTMAGQVADGFVARLPANLRAETSAAIGSQAAGVAALPASRQDADHVLRLLRGGRGAGGVAAIEEMAMQVLLARLADLAGDASLIADGPLAALTDHDRRHRTAYVDTLRAYLESFGDVPIAARLLDVHQNTFRYRLQRLQETPGLDLTDPDQRLSLLLQFRLLELRRHQARVGAADQ